MQIAILYIYLNSSINPKPFCKLKSATMKRNRPLSLYNSDNPPKAQQQESSTQPAQSKSPYLKAMLSGTTKSFAPENDLPVINPDRAAALRYIKESALLKKLYIEKMSC